MEAYRLGPKAGPVYEELRRRILSAEYAFGSRLPPHQELAAEFGVASLTMRQALAYLEREGLVSREPGRGTFVRDRRTNPARRGSQDRVRSSGMPGAILVFGPTGTITAGTPAAFALIKTPAEDLVGRSIHDPDIKDIKGDNERFQSDIHPVALALRSRRPVRDVVVRMRPSPDDEWLWLNVNAYPQLGPDEEVTHVICTLEDLKAASTTATTGIEDVTRAALEASPLAYLAFDQDGKITMWNTAAERSLGYSEEEVKGTISPIFARGSEETFHTLVSRVLTGETVSNIEAQRVTRDGQILDVHLSAAPIRNPGKAVVGGLAVITDATEHKRTEQALETVQARLHRVVEHTSDVIFTIDLRGNLTSFNRAAEELSGYRFADYSRLNIADILPPEQFDLARQMIAQKLADGRPTCYELEMRTRDGRRIPLELSTQIIMENGLPVGIQGIARDIRGRRRAEEALRESEERYRSLFENAHDMVYIHDLDGNFLSVNEAVERTLGYTIEEALQLNITAVVAPEHLDLAQRMIQGKLTTRNRTSYEIDALARDGRRRTLEINSQIIRRDGKPVAVQGIARDVTERRTYQERLLHQALHDSLTQLPNRDCLQREAVLAIDRMSDHGSVALVMLDLDHFKDLNDTFGHHYGDLLLHAAGSRLNALVPDEGMVARMGGDEFALLLPGAGREEAEAMARRVLSALEEPFEIDDQSIMAGASIGIALYPEHGRDVTSLMRRADVAMYRSKSMRGNVTVYEPERDPNSPGRLQLITDLRQSIRGDQLRLQYQPLVNIQTHRIDSAEALIRWQHPTRGLLLPDDFLPLAEHTGLIPPMTAWVLTHALRQCREWREHGSTMRVAVNIPSYLLHNPDFLDVISAELQTHGLTPADLTLEITEDALIHNAQQALSTLGWLHDMGIHVSIDDFGTGFSSLAYLNRMPIDELKIDRSFTTRLTRRPQDAAVVRSIIDLAHNLGIPVVAEGVEDARTLEALVHMGCDIVQGFYFSKPIDASALGPWLRGRAPERPQN